MSPINSMCQISEKWIYTFITLILAFNLCGETRHGIRWHCVIAKSRSSGINGKNNGNSKTVWETTEENTRSSMTFQKNINGYKKIHIKLEMISDHIKYIIPSKNDLQFLEVNLIHELDCFVDSTKTMGGTEAGIRGVRPGQKYFLLTCRKCTQLVSVKTNGMCPKKLWAWNIRIYVYRQSNHITLWWSYGHVGSNRTWAILI